MIQTQFYNLRKNYKDLFIQFALFNTFFYQLSFPQSNHSHSLIIQNDIIKTQELKYSGGMKNSNHQKNKKKRYHVDSANNFLCYEQFKLLVSEPNNYILVHVVIILGMIYFYVITFYVALIVYEINYSIIALHVVNMILLIFLGFKNPGIYLKITEDFDSPTKVQLPFDRDCKPAVNELAKSYNFQIKSHMIGLKFCPECLIFKPPRTVHCWICNACIANMDHHCPFIGNCIGKGNYQYFFGFVLTMTIKMILAITQLIFMEVKLFQREKEKIYEKPQMYFGFVLLLICVIVLCFVGSLMAFHIYLIINSLTTNELCKNTWDTISGNPFKKNFFVKNIFKFIQGPTDKMAPYLRENMQRTVVAREKDKSQQYMSEYESQDYVKQKSSQISNIVSHLKSLEDKKNQTVNDGEENHTGQKIIQKEDKASYI